MSLKHSSLEAASYALLTMYAKSASDCCKFLRTDCKPRGRQSTMTADARLQIKCSDLTLQHATLQHATTCDYKPWCLAVGAKLEVAHMLWRAIQVSH